MPRGNYVYMPVLLCCEILQITNIDASEHSRAEKSTEPAFAVVPARADYGTVCNLKKGLSCD